MYKYCRVGTTSRPWRGTRNSPRPHRSTPHQKNARATDRATCFPCKAPTGNARTSGAPREGEVMPDYPSFRDVIFPPAKTSGISISYFSTCLPHHILRHKSRLSHLSQFYHIAHTKKKGKLHKEDRLYHSNCTCRLLTFGHARTGTKHLRHNVCHSPTNRPGPPCRHEGQRREVRRGGLFDHQPRPHQGDAA